MSDLTVSTLLDPYVVVLLPFIAFMGVVGAIVAILRGRRRMAIAFGLIGVAAIVIAIALYYESV